MSSEIMMSGGPFYHHPFESPSCEGLSIIKESCSVINTIVIIAERHCVVYGYGYKAGRGMRVWWQEPGEGSIIS